MIINEKKRKFESNIEGDTQNFTIKASSKAFSVLSSNIYSDKIQAVIRELSTNAYDAHAMIGKKDLPFTVSLPDAIEPFFSVEDYGPGMSDEEVKQLYTQYFNSTKENSNDAVGCLGIGSKSPFSYVDSFSVTSRQKGTEISYVAFLTEDGTPAIREVSRKKTEKPDGVTVSVAVKREDFTEFKMKARRVLKFFKVRPNIISESKEFNWEEPKLILETEQAKFYEEHKLTNSSSIYVLQGNVVYPVMVNNLSDEGKSNYHFLSEYMNYNQWVLIEVPIGTLNISASREELHYDQQTRLNLEEILKVESDHFVNEARAKLENSKDMLDVFYQFGKFNFRFQERIHKKGPLKIGNKKVFLERDYNLISDIFEMQKGNKPPTEWFSNLKLKVDPSLRLENPVQILSSLEKFEKFPRAVFGGYLEYFEIRTTKKTNDGKPAARSRSIQEITQAVPDGLEGLRLWSGYARSFSECQFIIKDQEEKRLAYRLTQNLNDGMLETNKPIVLVKPEGLKEWYQIASKDRFIKLSELDEIRKKPKVLTKKRTDTRTNKIYEEELSLRKIKLSSFDMEEQWVKFSEIKFVMEKSGSFVRAAQKIPEGIVFTGVEQSAVNHVARRFLEWVGYGKRVFEHPVFAVNAHELRAVKKNNPDVVNLSDSDELLNYLLGFLESNRDVVESVLMYHSSNWWDVPPKINKLSGFSKLYGYLSSKKDPSEFNHHRLDPMTRLIVEKGGETEIRKREVQGLISALTCLSGKQFELSEKFENYLDFMLEHNQHLNDALSQSYGYKGAQALLNLIDQHPQTFVKYKKQKGTK